MAGKSAYISCRLDFMMRFQSPVVHREMCFNLLIVSSVVVLRSLGNGLLRSPHHPFNQLEETLRVCVRSNPAAVRSCTPFSPDSTQPDSVILFSYIFPRMSEYTHFILSIYLSSDSSTYLGHAPFIEFDSWSRFLASSSNEI